MGPGKNILFPNKVKKQTNKKSKVMVRDWPEFEGELLHHDILTLETLMVEGPSAYSLNVLSQDDSDLGQVWSL